MKRATAQVARELAECLNGQFPRGMTVLGNIVVDRATATRWLLLLAPPKKKRPRDVPRSAGIKERRATMRECDNLFRDLIRARDVHCQRCGGSSHLQVAHVFSRRFIRIRHHPLNAMLLCAKCHLFVHHHPIEAGGFFAAMLGAKYDGLAALKASNSRLPDLNLVKADLLKGGRA